MATIPVNIDGVTEIFDKEHFRINHVIAHPIGGEENNAMTGIYAENIDNIVNLHPYYGIKVATEEEEESIPISVLKSYLRGSYAQNESSNNPYIESYLDNNPYIESYLDNNPVAPTPDGGTSNYIEYKIGDTARIKTVGTEDYLFIKNINLRKLDYLENKRFAQSSYSVYSGTGSNSKWLGYIETFLNEEKTADSNKFLVISDDFLPIVDQWDEVVYYDTLSNTYTSSAPYYRLNISATRDYTLKSVGFKLKINLAANTAYYNGRLLNHIYAQYPLNGAIKNLNLGRTSQIIKRSYGNCVGIFNTNLTNLSTMINDKNNNNIPFSSIGIYDGNSFEEETLIGTVKDFQNFDLISSNSRYLRLYTAYRMPVYSELWDFVYYDRHASSDTEKYTADTPYYSLSKGKQLNSNYYNSFKLRVAFRTEANAHNGDIVSNITIRIPNN